MIDILKIAQATIESQLKELSELPSRVNLSFAEAVQAVWKSSGRLVISGIGKSAIIAQKIVATCNSTGTPALYLHAADAIHGDIGMIQDEDMVMIISKSGQSEEITCLAHLIKKFGNPMIALCGNAESELVELADYFIDCTVNLEACPNNLAPTTSTSAQLMMGDAFAICLLQLRGFNSNDFARVHPGGMLGKQLYLRVGSLANKNERPMVAQDADLNTIILSITQGRLGATAVVNQDLLIGIITDGDLRRMIQSGKTITEATQLMSPSPKSIDQHALAIDALQMMRDEKVSQLIVTDQKKYKGFVHFHDLLKEGII